MKLFFYEWKKLLFYQKGWLIILTALLLKLGYLGITDSPSYADIDLYRDAYLYYLQNVEGELNEEKNAYIENNVKLTASAEDELTETYLNFYAGNISEKECEEKARKLNTLSDRYRGMNALYEQYLYARQEPVKRWLVYPNGWAALLQSDQPDFFMLGTLLLLIVPLFCKDYKLGMDTLIITTARGCRQYMKMKERAALLLALLVQLLLCIEQFLFCTVKYGLPDAGYPLQSLEYFSGCSYAISLGEAFLFLTLLRLFGAVLLAVLICFTAVLARNYAVSCFPILCIMLIPYISLRDSLQYHLPLPLGFLRAVGYLRGDEVIQDAATGDETIAFSQITGLQLFGLCIAGILTILCCSIYMQCRHRNKIFTLRWRKYVLPTVLIVCSVLSGCTGDKNLEQTTTFYNSVSAESCPSNAASIQSPFQTGFTIMDCFYRDNDYIYYLSSHTADDSNIRLSERNGETTFRVMKQSVDTMEEDCILEVSYNRDSEWVFLDTVKAFFLNDSTIWFVTEDELWQVDRLTHTKKLSDIPVNGNIAYNGLGIYFIDKTMRLSCYDLMTNSIHQVGDIAAGNYVLTQYGIYFSNLRENNALYNSAIDGSTLKKIDADEITSLTLDDNNVIYYVMGSNTPHTIELKSAE